MAENGKVTASSPAREFERHPEPGAVDVVAYMRAVRRRKEAQEFYGRGPSQQ